MKNGVSRILGIPFFNALNSGNFSSTTTGKSSFLDQWSGGVFWDVEKRDENTEEVRENSMVKEMVLYFFAFLHVSR